MTHRGASGADVRDGDGAGVMTSIPHDFFAATIHAEHGIDLPPQGRYATGNCYLNPSEPVYSESKRSFERLAASLGLRVLCWRRVPRNSSILGPYALSKEPMIEQPFVVLAHSPASSSDAAAAEFDEAKFGRLLYLLRKQAAHQISLRTWFYSCSLHASHIVYKGLLNPNQVYDYFYDLQDIRFAGHFALVHSRFSTNTFPSWDRAQPLRMIGHNGEINTLRGNKNWMRAREGLMSSLSFGRDLESLYPIIEEFGSDSAALDNRQAFYTWASTLMEPWDGPALVTFADGRYVGAQLDRNGLRPCRFYVMDDDTMICASEVGCITLDPKRVVQKGRLMPGRMLLVDTAAGRIVNDNELKRNAGRKIMQALGTDRTDPRLVAFGYSHEQATMLLQPMAKVGKEALGSMGNDAPLACLSNQPRLVFDFLRQLFAQVTNPPIDPIRERIVMSARTYLGPEGNVLAIDPVHPALIEIAHPVLMPWDLAAVKRSLSVRTIAMTWPVEEGPKGMEAAIDRMCSEAMLAVSEGAQVLVLDDSTLGPELAPIPCALATGAVHHFLVRTKKRGHVSLVVNTGEAREVHHLAVVLGYGADALVPYLMAEAAEALGGSHEKYVSACMGISTLQSYRGAQIFEALGLHESVVAKRAVLACRAWPSREIPRALALPELGEYHNRYNGERHINDPVAIASLQDAVRQQNKAAFAKYSAATQSNGRAAPQQPIPLDEVEPWTEIVKRFCTGAMSYGSISIEAHATLAKALNAIGGKSNTGEGGEEESRLKNAQTRSSIKQIASGRFGVTVAYLSNADELQIKMAQGAKPGEGGELPGYKVSGDIARTRKSTPGVGLISPPPHHDIYSIEDLKQLIFDLKCVNPSARVSVKLVSEVGVGVVAAGVAKAGAHHILISGHDGGTGAARWSSVKSTGLPWELGLAEAHQTLVLNNLRGRVVLQTDGMIRTGRDVAIACMLGAEEFGFATAPLIAMGCVMMRACHKNTCPVGIATQDPVLRAKFAGQPEHVINFFHYLAEELREIMASVGVRTVSELVGRSDFLTVNPRVLKENPKARLLDLQPLLIPAFSLRQGVPVTMDPAEWKKPTEDDLRHKDHVLLPQAQLAIESRTPTTLTLSVTNTDRSIGALLSHQVAKLYGEEGLPDESLRIKLFGSAGQSLGVWLAKGIHMDLEGDSNDYVGKGLSGGTIAIYPPRARHAQFDPRHNVIIGNTCLYGATSGRLFVNGMAAERFCVRNSGATAVCEGLGDHGCEYMTGGVCLVLGPTGVNFAAGMSGGLAYVLDLDVVKCNVEMVDLDPLSSEDLQHVHGLISDHFKYTGSPRAQEMLASWQSFAPRFTKVFPKDYKAVLARSNTASIPRTIAPAAEPNGVAGKHKPAVVHAHGGGIADIEDAMAAAPAKKVSKADDALDKTRGFIKYKRVKEPQRPVRQRVKDYKEVGNRHKPRDLRVQAARCMDCGVPTCNSSFGCPISNLIPSWNELVFKEDYRAAFDRLMLTNNFPEFTGRVCPAPCEGACVLGINEDPVNIKSIECAIIDYAFDNGWVVPTPPQVRTGRRVAVIGSGPAGLAAADQLNKAGHWVTVYERQDKAGGLLQYGIPNMKLDKRYVQRRVDLLTAEGVQFKCSVDVGKDVAADQIVREFDSVLLATGATWPRDLPVAGRNLNGIHFAVDFLTQSIKNGSKTPVSVEGKHVVVIGGGDTGTDCCGTSVRQGAKSIFPRVFKVDYGHEEYQVLTEEFVSDGNGNVRGINTVTVEWTKDPQSGRWSMSKVPGSHKFYPADVQMGVAKAGANVAADTKTYATSVPKVFAAGDCRRGQSLVVWGIREGREAARQMDAYLMSSVSALPITGGTPARDLYLEYSKIPARHGSPAPAGMPPGVEAGPTVTVAQV
ncbi:hypothetical protein BCR44DRAFT_1444394 [Catenaria anguillulae PL171]|uniref:glutamate synthase (NADH) n=1 Tax=Catenaria anguillulae PL171 TaxID=765915 RepID=A0A1Y2H9B2_9FUNG|nr:hypothetical protein BCR44DRAFT_1444394 [Catenaria anguillulae PL171]